MADNVVEIIIRARDEASGKINDVKKSLEGSEKALLGIGAALVAASGAIAAATLAGAQRADALNESAQKIGLSVEQLSRLELVAKTSGSSIDGLSTSFKFLQRNITLAAEGGDEAVKALDRVGLTFRDLQGLNPEEQLLRVADGLTAIQVPAERATAAVALLGRSGTELIPALRLGSTGIKDLTEKADRLGITVNELQAALGDKLADEVTTLNLQVQALKTSLVVGLAPALIAVAQAAQNALGGLIGFISANPALIRDVADLALNLGGLALAAAALPRIFAAVGAAATALAGSLGLGAAAANPLAAVIVAIGIALGALAVSQLKARNELEKKIAFDINTDSLDDAQKKIDALIEKKKNLDQSLAQSAPSSFPRPPGFGDPAANLPKLPIISTVEFEGQRITVERAKELLKVLDQQIETGQKHAEVLKQQAALRELLKTLATGTGKADAATLKALADQRNAVAQIVAMTKQAQDIGSIKLGVGAQTDQDLIATRLKLEELIATGEEAARKIALIQGNVAVDGVPKSVDELQKLVDKGEEARKALDIVGTVKVKVDLEPLDPGQVKLPLNVDAEELNGFLEALGLTNQAISRIVEKVAEFKEGMTVLGQTGADVFAGLAAGFEAFSAYAAERFSLVTEIGRGVFDSLKAFAEDFADTFALAFDQIVFAGKNVFDSIGNFLIGVGKLIEQLLRDIAYAIVRALALKAVLAVIGGPIGLLSSGGTVGLAQGGSVVRRAALPAALALGGMIAPARMASGGSVAAPSWAQTSAPSPVFAAAGLWVVPGATQKTDVVPAMLSPGEVVLPTVDSKSPAEIVGDLAGLRDLLQTQITNARTTPTSGVTNNVSIAAFNLDALREMLRHGDLRREELRRDDLGR